MDETAKAGREVSGFLATLLSSQTMSLAEVYASVAELMAAAVDTVGLLS